MESICHRLYCSCSNFLEPYFQVLSVLNGNQGLVGVSCQNIFEENEYILKIVRYILTRFLTQQKY